MTNIALSIILVYITSTLRLNNQVQWIWFVKSLKNQKAKE